MKEIKTTTNLGFTYIEQIGRIILQPQQNQMSCSDSVTTISATCAGILKSVTFHKDGCTLQVEEL